MRAQADRALRFYGMEGARVVFIRHNENHTSRVEDGSGRRYLLRIHRSAADVAASHTLEKLEAEMALLEALGKDGTLTTQRPVRTEAGEAVAALGADERGPLYATLLSWIDGETLREDHEAAARHAEWAGEMAARLRRFASGWAGEGYAFFRYDGERLRAALTAIRAGMEGGVITAPQYVQLEETAERMAGLMETLAARPGESGLIHADLGLSNMIALADGVAPIDFSLCGRGCFLQDVGGLLGAVGSPRLRERMLSGYARHYPLAAEDLRFVEAFFVLGVYLFMGMHIGNPKFRGWFEARLPGALEGYIRDVAEDRRFLPGPVF